MKKIPIGVELYTVREAFAENPEETFKKLRALGYEGVEFSGSYEKFEAERLKEALEKEGLACYGYLISWKDALPDRIEQTLRYNEALGNHTIAIGSVSTSITYEKKTLYETIDYFNKLYSELESTPFSIGYHNHDTDFYLVEGKSVWEHIFDNTPQGFNMVLDTGNALAGGFQSVPLIEKYPGRQPWMHIKPYSAVNYTETGYGTMIGEDDFDWPKLLRTCVEVGGTKVFTIEFGNRARYQPFYGAELCIKNLREQIAKM